MHRAVFLTLFILAGGCDEKRDFDTRYDEAAEDIAARAEAIDAELESGEQEAGAAENGAAERK